MKKQLGQGIKESLVDLLAILIIIVIPIFMDLLRVIVNPNNLSNNLRKVDDLNLLDQLSYSILLTSLMFLAISYSYVNNPSKKIRKQFNRVTHIGNIFMLLLLIIPLMVIEKLEISYDTIAPLTKDWVNASTIGVFVLSLNSYIHSSTWVNLYGDADDIEKESNIKLSIRLKQIFPELTFRKEAFLKFLIYLILSVLASIVTGFLASYDVNTPNFMTVFVGWFTLITFFFENFKDN